MSQIVPDDPAEPLCEGREAHEWHVICAQCGMPGYHDSRSEELRAWDRLIAERNGLRAALAARGNA